VHADDERLGRLLRQIRRESALTQAALAKAAGVPRFTVQLLEDGRAADVLLGRIRRVFESVDGRARLVPWWNGAMADQLLDRRHAAIVERVVRLLTIRGWNVDVEVSFSSYGDRGSIDVLGTRARVLAVCEIKSVIGSLEETNRRLDVKARLAPKIVFERTGIRPTTVGRLLIVPRDSSVRRVINEHAATMLSLYPARSREVRAWLRRPQTPIRGLWFVSDPPHTSSGQR
jgi:hypothetical protein